MTAPFGGRDGDIEAFIVDRYLESLLARRPADPDAIPPELRATAHRLRRDLPRHHPSFRFEERLALRLAEAAAAMRAPVAAGAEGIVIRLPLPRGSASESAPTGAAGAGQPAAASPVVIGGVLTSAALSLAGAVYVAWRLSRPPALDPMRRVVRTVARARSV